MDFWFNANEQWEMKWNVKIDAHIWMSNAHTALELHTCNPIDRRKAQFVPFSLRIYFLCWFAVAQVMRPGESVLRNDCHRSSRADQKYHGKIECSDSQIEPVSRRNGDVEKLRVDSYSAYRITCKSITSGQRWAGESGTSTERILLWMPRTIASAIMSNCDKRMHIGTLWNVRQ